MSDTVLKDVSYAGKKGVLPHNAKVLIFTEPLRIPPSGSKITVGGRQVIK
jgi:hypothetical protein